MSDRIKYIPHVTGGHASEAFEIVDGKRKAVVEVLIDGGYSVVSGEEGLYEGFFHTLREAMLTAFHVADEERADA